MHKFIQSRWRRQGLVFGLSCLLILGIFVLSASFAKAKTTLKVAVEPTYPPFELLGENNEIDGFDVDLFKAIAQASDFEIAFVTMQFDGMIPALQAKTVDAAIAAMTITAERQKVVDFSRPYFRSGLAIAIKADNTEITSLESLQNKKVAVQIGTTGAAEAAKIPGAKISTFDSSPLVLQELINGNVDAAINDAAVTLYAIKENNLKSIKIINQLLTEEYYGIPTPKGSPYLNDINKGLAIILGNGTYNRLYRKWFNAEAPPLPETINFDKSTTPLKATNVILNAMPYLLQGVFVTLYLTAFSVFLGMIGGSLLGIARLSTIAPLRWATRAYIDFFRGTPLLVQIFMIYFGIPALMQSFGINFNLGRLTASVIALSLNSSAYIAEIVRAGIQSIDIGQSEAAQSLGLGRVETMRYVIFPQALRRMLPPLGNEFITLLKDTSLVAVIGFEELFQQGRLIVANNYRAFEIYAAVALIYLALTLLSSRTFSFLERSMNPVKAAK
ncbi:ABC transporter permease subunit [Funiculus sociatus GB2-A5]|uniref:ABC transporter permease subunit n=1 Tax=Funiculus sociatus GB2-A5 TaxID=2933946 RepID=A0ABV0JK53_9CYAN|nr:MULTISPECIES: ABC transporter permease subunit [unclassified Trichocoleus]MBD1908375.1 ABC transporter permease subunit [Trichocoleus sp. FACHB-832]MBD2061721.1 ABC transporter permease subunit [Trichocoleus sp. FACHB-6]